MRFAVLSAGAPRHGKTVTRQWQEISDSKGWGWELSFLEWQRDGYASYDLGGMDVCVWMGCFELVFEWMRDIPGPEHVAYWIGTDILQHRDLVARGYEDPFRSASIHLADAPNLAEEARRLTGLEVGHVRTIPSAPIRPSPISGWDHVLCYVPHTREDFFRYPWIREVAGDFPDLVFDVLRPGIGEGKREGNVNELSEQGRGAYLGLLESSFCLLRPIVHDGISLTLVEAAQCGRHIIHSGEHIPHVLKGRSVGEIEYQLETLVARRPQFDPKVREWYAREYSVERLADDVARLRDVRQW